MDSINCTAEATNRISRLENTLKPHVAGGTYYLIRHKDYFLNRPQQQQLTYFSGVALASLGLAILFSRETPGNIDLSNSNRIVSGLSGVVLGASGSTLAYMVYTERSEEYTKHRSYCVKNALVEGINQIYGDDEVLQQHLCPILNCIMFNPVILPNDPKVIQDCKERNEKLPDRYTCDRSSIQLGSETKQVTHYFTRHLFNTSELIEDHEMAILIYKRIRHLLNRDLSLIPESNTLERVELKKYLFKIEKRLKENYEGFNAMAGKLLLSTDPEAQKEYVRMTSSIKPMCFDPWSNVQNESQVVEILPNKKVSRKPINRMVVFPSTNILEAVSGAHKSGLFAPHK